MLEKITFRNSVHPQALRSMYWECAQEVNDPGFEKEAWVSATLLRFGDCGFTVGQEATLFYCDRRYAPGVVKVPTGPVSADAAIITSLFINSERQNKGLEAVLIDAAIIDLSNRNFAAVEAFGYYSGWTVSYAPLGEPGIEDEVNFEIDSDMAMACYDRTRHFLGIRPEDIGLMSVDVLLAAGFEIISDHPLIPRLRLELPPSHDLLSAAAAEDLVAKALA
ncbi:MAG: hypothetical protein SOW59_06230 [Corynebacterium sp.]|nr:hypothetical protein [Corynebacterium sp.]